MNDPFFLIYSGGFIATICGLTFESVDANTTSGITKPEGNDLLMGVVYAMGLALFWPFVAVYAVGATVVMLVKALR